MTLYVRVHKSYVFTIHVMVFTMGMESPRSENTWYSAGHSNNISLDMFANSIYFATL